MADISQLVLNDKTYNFKDAEGRAQSQTKALSSSVEIGTETVSTVEEAIGATADVVPSTATEQNKLATAADVTGEDIAVTVTGTTITITDGTDTRVQNIQIFGHTESGSSVGGNGLTVKSTSPLGAVRGIAVTNIDEVTYPLSNRIQFTMKFNSQSLPENYVCVMSGVVATSNNVLTDISNIYNELTIYGEKVQYVKETGKPKNVAQYTWYKSNVLDTDIWYARPYMVCLDNDTGIQYITYGNIWTATLTGYEEMTNTSGECTELLLPITTGLPLRSADENIYDELDCAAGTVTTRCEVVEGEVVPLDVPAVTELSATELAAWRKFRIFAGNTIVTATDNPQMIVTYLKNTDNGKVVSIVANDLQKQISDVLPISSMASGTLLTIDDSTDARVQGLTIKGRSHCKNLVEITKQSETYNGVTFTIDKAAGTITANGKATNNINLNLMPTEGNDHSLSSGDRSILYLHANTYRLTDIRSYESNESFKLILNNINGVSSWQYAPHTFTIKDPTHPITIGIYITAGTTMDNVLFKPMICTVLDYEADHTFEPYSIHSVGDNGLTITSISPIGADSLRVSAEVTNVERTPSTSLKFTVTFNFPTGTTPIRCGLVATSNNVMTDISDIYNNLTLYGDKVQYIKDSGALPEADTDFNFEWTKTSVQATDIWYVRPYAIYSTNNGVYLKYGHIDVSTTAADEMLSDSNGECTELLLPITTGLPLRSTDENIYDEIDLAKGIVITRCEVVEREVVPLDTPTVTELAATEITAWRKFRTFAGNTVVTVTDNPKCTIDYLKNTDNGRALAAVQDDVDKQIEEIRAAIAE